MTKAKNYNENNLYKEVFMQHTSDKNQPPVLKDVCSKILNGILIFLQQKIETLSQHRQTNSIMIQRTICGMRYHTFNPNDIADLLHRDKFFNINVVYYLLLENFNSKFYPNDLNELHYSQTSTKLVIFSTG